MPVPYDGTRDDGAWPPDSNGRTRMPKDLDIVDRKIVSPVSDACPCG
jgi:hypothetical protein